MLLNKKESFKYLEVLQADSVELNDVKERRRRKRKERKKKLRTTTIYWKVKLMAKYD